MRFGWLIICIMLALVAGCKQRSAPAEKFHATDITGVNYGKDFQLTDQNGVARTLADFRGKLVVLFFGYTHCPDVCPTTLGDLATAMKLMGNDAQKVQVVFVTVDPERDTPALLAQYVPAFNPTFLGLYGTDSAIAKTAKEFRIFFQKQPKDEKGRYAMDHTAGTYVLDQKGRLRLFMGYGQASQAIAHDLKLLLKLPL